MLGYVRRGSWRWATTVTRGGNGRALARYTTVTATAAGDNASSQVETRREAGYTLYTIVAHTEGRESQTSHSMHVNKTKADLALLGVPYTEAKLTFSDIRGALAAESGDGGVTVPTLRTPNGEYVTDSFRIAEYLDARQGEKASDGSAARTALRLFPTPDALSYARFINAWADGPMAAGIRELFRPLFGTLNDAVSYEYFVRVRYAGAAGELAAQLDALRDPAKVRTLAERARAALAPMETALAAAPCLGSMPGPFMLGRSPSHADAAVFGWYLCSQVNARVTNPQVWHHASLPHISAWAEAMADATGLSVTFPDPEGFAV